MPMGYTADHEIRNFTYTIETPVEHGAIARSCQSWQWCSVVSSRRTHDTVKG